MSDKLKSDLGGFRDQLRGDAEEPSEGSGLMGRLGAVFSRKSAEADIEAFAVQPTTEEEVAKAPAVDEPKPALKAFKAPRSLRAVDAEKATAKTQTAHPSEPPQDADGLAEPEIFAPREQTAKTAKTEAPTDDLDAADGPNIPKPVRQSLTEHLGVTKIQPVDEIEDQNEPEMVSNEDAFINQVQDAVDAAEDVEIESQPTVPELEAEELAIEENEENTAPEPAVEQASADDFLAALRRLNTDEAEQPTAVEEPTEEPVAVEIEDAVEERKIELVQEAPVVAKHEFVEVAPEVDKALTETSSPETTLEEVDAIDEGAPEDEDLPRMPNFVTSAPAVETGDQVPASGDLNLRTATISVTIDNQRLEDIVSDAIRRELEGQLGLQITDTIKSFVEAEVARIVQEQGILPRKGE